MNNIFCNKKDLKNEATVESFFVDRLLDNLGYPDEDISLKESISEFAVGKGSKKVLYKPDYILKTSGIPTIVIDAKSPDVNIMDFELQCSSYCLELNKEFDYNPVEYYILSNGLSTSLYKWDSKSPLLSLDFIDFNEKSELFAQLKDLVARENTTELALNLKANVDDKKFRFSKVPLEKLSDSFQKLHQDIWQSEKMSPAAAFHELIKIFFVKIRAHPENGCLTPLNFHKA